MAHPTQRPIQVTPGLSIGSNPLVPKPDIATLGEDRPGSGGYSRGRAARISWLRRELESLIGAGHAPDEDIVAELPPALQKRARAVAEAGVAAFRSGDRQEARRMAHDLVFELDAGLDDDWTPPRERPDRDVIDDIVGRNWL